MWFGSFHTVAASPSGDCARRQSETEIVGISLLGNSFHAETARWPIVLEASRLTTTMPAAGADIRLTQEGDIAIELMRQANHRRNDINMA